MSDTEILELAEKHGLGLNLYGALRLYDNGDGTMSFRRSGELTTMGNIILSFARVIEDKLCSISRN